MRASETVSEASPGSTASQTGVPTQVVQQGQGAQQVSQGGGCEGPHGGAVWAFLRGPSAYLSRCSI